MKKIGIIICGHYQSCGGGKCFRAVRERVGEPESDQDDFVTRGRFDRVVLPERKDLLRKRRAL
jgi:hypothetical protein